MVFCRTTACFADKAGSVTIVNHYQCVVFFCQVADFVHLGNISVHREHSIGNDDPVTLSLRNLQLLFEVSHVGVFVSVAYGFTKTNTVNDRSVVQFIRDDGIFLTE